MELLAAGCLSEQQNQLFASVLDWLHIEHQALVVAAEPTAANIIYMCGLPTGQNLDRWRPLAAPVMAAPRYRDEPIYFSDIICRPGLENLSWAQVKGARIGYNERVSFSGWAVLMIELERLGIEPSEFDWVETGSHRNSIAAVESGVVDLAAVDSIVLTLEGFTGATLATLGPWPAPPISVSNELQQEADSIATILTSMHTHQSGRQLLAECGVARFQAVDRESYRSLARIVGRLVA
ncbi:MAG TPA: PhnD/SsuA/transferrin family substrate-binding protein [Acidimicrobiia bacterium]|nr:PhnD/SsuA/transferrin family substrate-binding protein [Acidimicrobiia bacterium]